MKLLFFSNENIYDINIFKYVIWFFLIIVTKLYMESPELVHFAIGSFYPLTNITSIFLFLVTWILCSFEFWFFTQVWTNNFCFSLIYFLKHIDLKGYPYDKKARISLIYKTE